MFGTQSGLVVGLDLHQGWGSTWTRDGAPPIMDGPQPGDPTWIMDRFQPGLWTEPNLDWGRGPTWILHWQPYVTEGMLKAGQNLKLHVTGGMLKADRSFQK